jgi:predicted deacetylase
VKSLVVSLHDVSPLTQSLCDQILVQLRELGIGQVSLLIIPNHHGRAPIGESPAFQRWLSRAIEAGHEPVLHGYYHRRERGKADSFVRRVMTEFYTAGEGEFYNPSSGEAATLLERGLADLSFLPRKIAGFIAPAWLLGAEAEAAVRDLGFLYTTRLSTVRVFNGNGNCDIASQSLVWSTRAAWRISMSLVWNRTLSFSLGCARLVRIGIHPPDAQDPLVWKQVRKLIMATIRSRQCVSYEKFIENLAR